MAKRRVVVSSRVRAITYRPPSASFIATMRKCSRNLLEHAKQCLQEGNNNSLDTAVMDEIAQGVASIVRSAYDCESIALALHDSACWAFIESSTAEWFRCRGFSEWFCLGAAVGFNTSRPRILSEFAEFGPIVRRRRSPGRRRKKPNSANAVKSRAKTQPQKSANV